MICHWACEEKEYGIHKRRVIRHINYPKSSNIHYGSSSSTSTPLMFFFSSHLQRGTQQHSTRRQSEVRLWPAPFETPLAGAASGGFPLVAARRASIGSTVSLARTSNRMSAVSP